ncbi:MAG: hypothetical protein JNL74_23235 [Fibrobacteres bacterium]|nr:hypothetical protein [Fibrobacterota bacterium]
MKFLKTSVLLSFFFLLVSCASLIESDFVEPAIVAPSFSVKNGLEVWDNPVNFPEDKIVYLDSMEYNNGSTYKELETMALAHAKKIGADGINVADIENSNASLKVDVGAKRAELVINGFDLEEHGIGPDTLHFSKNVYTTKTLFKIHVKFFKYKSR